MLSKRPNVHSRYRAAGNPLPSDPRAPSQHLWCMHSSQSSWGLTDLQLQQQFRRNSGQLYRNSSICQTRLRSRPGAEPPENRKSTRHAVSGTPAGCRSCCLQRRRPNDSQTCRDPCRSSPQSRYMGGKEKRGQFLLDFAEPLLK